MDNAPAPTEMTIAEGRKVFPPHWAMSTPAANSGQKLALLLLALHADNDTLRCWVSVAKLAAEGACTPVTMRRGIDGLADAGRIAVVPLARSQNGSQTSNAYILNIEGWLDEVRTVEALVEAVERRSAGVSEQDGADFIPRRFTVADDLNGLRLPFSQVKPV